MRWQIKYLEEAKKDFKKLDRSAQIIVLKGIDKVNENPLLVQQGGYGKSLGNKSRTNLTNLLKIKFPFLRCLHGDHMGINTVFFHEFIMISALYNLSVRYNKNLVRVLYGL